jgi:ribokinase
VDATAAGDTFNGALAVALAEGRDMAGAISFANTAAALSVTRLGAQVSIPTRDQVEAVYGEMRTEPNP